MTNAEYTLAIFDHDLPRIIKKIIFLRDLFNHDSNCNSRCNDICNDLENLSNLTDWAINDPNSTYES